MYMGSLEINLKHSAQECYEPQKYRNYEDGNISLAVSDPASDYQDDICQQNGAICQRTLTIVISQRKLGVSNNIPWGLPKQYSQKRGSEMVVYREDH